MNDLKIRELLSSGVREDGMIACELLKSRGVQKIKEFYKNWYLEDADRADALCEGRYIIKLQKKERNKEIDSFYYKVGNERYILWCATSCICYEKYEPSLEVIE